MLRQPTDIYRLYDGHGQLLYVGISKATPTRLLTHAGEQSWWSEVRRIEIAPCPSGREAWDAESDALHAEQPRHNVDRRGTRTKRDYSGPGIPCDLFRYCGSEATYTTTTYVGASTNARFRMQAHERTVHRCDRHANAQQSFHRSDPATT